MMDCVNSTVHFLLTYRLAMLVPSSEWPLKPVQCAFFMQSLHPMQRHQTIMEVTGSKFMKFLS